MTPDEASLFRAEFQSLKELIDEKFNGITERMDFGDRSIASGVKLAEASQAIVLAEIKTASAATSRDIGKLELRIEKVETRLDLLGGGPVALLANKLVFGASALLLGAILTALVALVIR
jgi:hypothetical protein